MGGVGVPLEKGVDAGRRPERCTTHISVFSASNMLLSYFNAW
jgi:hypothetical protein